MPRSRACVISASTSCGAAGTPCSASQRPFTFPAICCFGSWPTGCRPTIWATWTTRVSACSTARPHRSRQDAALTRQVAEAPTIRPGTVLGREWNGEMHRVAVLAEGFAWNGNTYPSLSKIAFAITGTRWNGPRFFGLREKASKQESLRHEDSISQGCPLCHLHPQIDRAGA